MIGLLQRVTEASVRVSGQLVAEIGPGLLILVAIERYDTRRTADRLLERLLAYRVFPDEAGRMNLSLTDTGGELLLVPQFTLAADTRHGNRPGFEPAAAPAEARELFRHLVEQGHARGVRVQSGEFGSEMAVALVNSGPVTFSLRVPPAAPGTEDHRS